MHRTTRWAVTALILFALAPSAARAGDFTDSGFYLGVGATAAIDLFEDELSDAIGTSVDVDTGWGLNALLGYRLLSFLALEAQYEWIDEFDISIDSGPTVGIGTHTLTGNAKLIIPVWRIQPYIVGGVGLVRFDLDGPGVSDSDTVFGGRLGGGVDLFITQSVVLNGYITAVLTTQDLDAIGSGDNLNYLTAGLGLHYHF